MFNQTDFFKSNLSFVNAKPQIARYNDFSTTSIKPQNENYTNEVIQYNNGNLNFGFGFSTKPTGSNIILNSSIYSKIEQDILNSTQPIEINETEIVNANGQIGIWANKQEVVNWKGVIPITQYVINEDANPEIIRKRTEQVLTYEQEIAIRYLRPPTPPPPGEIVIRQEKNIVTPPAPPLVIRQQPPRPETPAPLIIREAPPRPPAAIGQKVVTISGKRLPPPPRKVIIERLAPLPNKPQSYIIERWLPYSQTKRRVIFQKPTEADPVIPRPRNVIVQWEAPEVRIKKEFKDLGIIRANPVEYVQRYGATLKQHVELPDFVRQIRPPTGVVLAAEFNAPSLFELEGDVQALTLIDLDREGLGEYRAWLNSLSYSQQYGYQNLVKNEIKPNFMNSMKVSVTEIMNAILAELFRNVNFNENSKISIKEAENVLIRLNYRLGRMYTQDDAKSFFKAYDYNKDGYIGFEEFKRGLLAEFKVI